jgi:cytochrome c oxidase subunit 1
MIVGGILMATRSIDDSATTVVRRRSLSESYLGLWLTTTDHKLIGLMYIVTGFFFFLVGGMEALLIRTQLAQPNGKVLSPEAYNAVFTMHGITMIFLFVIPVL